MDNQKSDRLSTNNYKALTLEEFAPFVAKHKRKSTNLPLCNLENSVHSPSVTLEAQNNYTKVTLSDWKEVLHSHGTPKRGTHALTT